jgi:hypothetical protein
MKGVKVIKSIARYFSTNNNFKSEHTAPNPNLNKNKVSMDNPVAYKMATGEVPPWDSKNNRFDMSGTHVDKNEQDNKIMGGKENIFQNDDANNRINKDINNSSNNKNANRYKCDVDPNSNKIGEHPEDQIAS